MPKVRRCVGDPPRQIEDPHSPPCVPYWAGGNGGATWPGVTADEVRIGYVLYLASAATNQACHPEWLINSYAFTDVNFWGRAMSSDQWRNAFGLTFLPKQVGWADHPAVHATQEVDPGYAWWQPSTYPQASAMAARPLHGVPHYRIALLLASGVQMTGPHLTPETFGRGLQTTRFPSPQTPLQAGRAGFAPGNYAMTGGAAEIWWDPFLAPGGCL